MKPTVLGACCVLALTATAAQAANDAAVLACVNGFLDATAGSKPDIDKASRYWISGEQTVVDEFAPYRWTGHRALRAWWTGVLAHNSKDPLTDMAMTRSPPRVLEDGGHAYVVMPTRIQFKEKGQPHSLEGEQTFVLDHTAKGWKISSFAWSGAKATP
jgi:ketosteroid isomerase-like protein